MPYSDILLEKAPDQYREVVDFIEECLRKNLNNTILLGVQAELTLELWKNREKENIEIPKGVSQFIFGITKFEKELFDPFKDIKKKFQKGLIIGEAPHKFFPNNFLSDNVELLQKILMEMRNDLLQESNLDPYDREVYSAVVTLWYAGNKEFTPQIIFNVLSGFRQPMTKITPDQRKMIMESLIKMRGMEVEIEASRKAEDCFHYKGSLLPFESVKEKTIPGQKSDDYTYIIRLTSEPPLYSHAKNEDEIGYVNMKILESNMNNVTQENVIVRGYLLREMLRANNFTNEDVKATIDYRKLCRYIGKRHQRTRSNSSRPDPRIVKKVEQYIQFLTDNNFIEVKEEAKSSNSENMTVTFDTSSILRHLGCLNHN